ncbi:hypothetical protein IV102_04460 [bacterium]|nr:hypothetical protein [bacterium]
MNISAHSLQARPSVFRSLSPLPPPARPQESGDTVVLSAIPSSISAAEIKDRSGFAVGKVLLGLGVGVAAVMLTGCNAQPTPEQPMLASQNRGDFGEYRGDFTVQHGRVQGDFGEYRGDYTATPQGNGTHVVGDFGEYRGDFTVQNGRVQGDFGEYRGDYSVASEGEGFRVRGDFGEYRGDYTISPNGNVTRIAGDFGEYRGDFTVTTQGQTTHVAGDFGEYRGDYTITPEGEGFRVSGDFGEYRGDYVVGKEAAQDTALLHPLGVGSLIKPDSPYAPMRWPSAMKAESPKN